MWSSQKTSPFSCNVATLHLHTFVILILKLVYASQNVDSLVHFKLLLYILVMHSRFFTMSTYILHATLYIA